MDSSIPKSGIDTLSKIVKRASCRLIQKKLRLVHIKKDISYVFFILKFLFSHFHAVHKRTDMRPQKADRTGGFITSVKKAHGQLLI